MVGSFPRSLLASLGSDFSPLEGGQVENVYGVKTNFGLSASSEEYDLLFCGVVVDGIV